MPKINQEEYEMDKAKESEENAEWQTGVIVQRAAQ